MLCPYHAGDNYFIIDLWRNINGFIYPFISSVTSKLTGMVDKHALEDMRYPTEDEDVFTSRSIVSYVT